MLCRLKELAQKYGVDKLHSHSYIPFYEELFAGMNVRRLLEIGIGYEDLMKPFVPFYVHGASLKMWEEYFPEAEIFACDIREDTLINEGRIRSFWCDQSDPKQVALMGSAICSRSGHLDVIIDDGSHETEHQITTARQLIPYLDAGGAYIIEDAREPKHLVYMLGGLVHAGRIHSVEAFEFGKRPDDNLVVIRR